MWITGIPSSGKSTFAQALHAHLRERGVASVVLDSDVVRAALRPTPGYDAEARLCFYASLANLAALLETQGLVAVVPATAHLREYRERARAVAERFLEVYIDTPKSEAEGRDSKGLYAAARAGNVHDLPGADAAYEPPRHPDLVAQGGHDQRAVARLADLLADPGGSG